MASTFNPTVTFDTAHMTYDATRDAYHVNSPGTAAYFVTDQFLNSCPQEKPDTMSNLDVLAEGLSTAVKAGFISKKEARREFRNNVPSIVTARANRLKAKDLRKKAKALQKEADSLT